MRKAVNEGSNSSELHDDKRGMQVVSRAVAVLRALGANPQGLSLGAIAAATALPRSTVQRIVDALEVEEFVESMGAGGGTRLGPAFTALTHTPHGDIIAIARPHLKRLSSLVNETVGLASTSGRESVMVDRIVAERELCIMVAIGATLDPTTSSVGKALLAQLPDAAIKQILGNALPDRKTAGPNGLRALNAQLSEIRKTGFSYDREQSLVGVCSVAVALNTFMGPYAVAIATPTSRFDLNLQRLEEELLRCKSAIERETGERQRAPLEKVKGKNINPHSS